MSLSSWFLNLSMKEQICLAIISLTLFCILVILIVCCSLMYEILIKDYEQKKLYFYNRYKDYIESTFYFQNFYMMQYEETIHHIQKQTWRLQQASYIYGYLLPLKNLIEYAPYIKNITSESDFTQLDLNNKIESPYFYIISFHSLDDARDYVYNFSLANYQTFSSSIITHDIDQFFRIPGYNVPVIDKPLYSNLMYLSLFSFDYNKTSNRIKELNNSKAQDETIGFFLNKTLESEIITFKEIIKNYIKQSNENGDIEVFPQIFEKFYKEILNYSSEIFINEKLVDNYSNLLTGYVSGINYENDNFSMLTAVYDNYYKSEMNTIQNLLFFLNNKLTYLLDIDFIPLNLGKNKILSKELCSLFKIKQKFLSENDFNYEDIYNNIHKLESNLDDCFIENELIKDQEEIKDIFDLEFENFIDKTNFIYRGIFNLIQDHNEFPFYFLKYSYPNYNSLKEFQSEYLFTSQVNFYAFIPFRIVQKYVDHVNQVTLNIFYLIIMVILYSWLICLFINLIIFFKVIDQWTEPITKLQEAVENSNIKDDSIFVYKYDDIINELFLTCKELLTGQIDNNNNDNGMKNFNILGKEKEKKIDKNIYKKNLIINNEIMEDLINKQQSMLDFSNNIKVNEPNNINSINSTKNIKIKKKSENSLDNHSKEEKDKEKEKLKKEKDKENETYINLFKIAEYLQYYRSKQIINNNININNDIESKKSKVVSKNTKSINSSLSNNRNEENNEYGNSINMLDEDNISYLWYMETKKKYKNFNYNISSDYKELFTEFNDSYKNIQRSDIKKSTNLNKRDRNTGV